jgi:NlpC/P60 family putative phage cell wall peptidase
MTRDEFIAEARTWIGTPYHHQARVKGVGVDCVGLVICALGLDEAALRLPAYSRQGSGTLLRSLLERHCDEIQIAEARPGSLYGMRFKHTGPEHHLAIVTDRGILHAWEGATSVYEHAVQRHWREGRILSAWNVRGVG